MTDLDYNDFEWLEADIDGLRSAQADGRATSKSLTKAYLDRIARIDRNGPTLRSIIEINPGALEIAAELDQQGALRGKTAGRFTGCRYMVPAIAVLPLPWCFALQARDRVIEVRMQR